jgi:CBS domain containing-hemolysin-like protein
MRNSTANDKPSGLARASSIFNFRREVPKKDPYAYTPPFTEMIEPPKDYWRPVGRVLQGTLNVLLLLVLFVALVVLVLVYGYLLATQPETLANFSSQLIRSVSELAQSFLSLFQGSPSS